MGTKRYKPVTPGRRHMIGYDFAEITAKASVKSLLKNLKSRAGRSTTTGRITVHHKGGGHKRKYRIIDFKQFDKLNVPATIEAIEYDPNRSAYIALLKYSDGERRYIISPEGIQVGDQIICAEKTKLKPGNRMKIKNIPEGSIIYNVELKQGKGGQMVRGAGNSATLISLKTEMAQVRLPSGEVRLVDKECFASIGTVSNGSHSQIKIGKAGRNRWLGKRPHVRGKAKNIREHPHGSGEGRNPIGMKYPKTPWGKHALGVKTRRNKRTNKFILSRRKKK